MPRRSRLDVAANLRPVLPGEKLAPPDTLRDDMKEEWWKIVGRMPSGWFTAEQLPVLEDLCQIIVDCRNFARELNKVGDPTKLEDPKEIKRYNWLSSHYKGLAALKASLSHKLRLTVRSQRSTSALEPMRGAALEVPPWEDDDEPDGERRQ